MSGRSDIHQARKKSFREPHTHTMSVNFNVLRYSLFGAGIVYGAVHRYNIESAEAREQAAVEWKKEEKLIAEAKTKWAKMHPPKAAQSSSKGSINWEDPNLDFGAAIESLVAKLD